MEKMIVYKNMVFELSVCFNLHAFIIILSMFLKFKRPNVAISCFTIPFCTCWNVNFAFLVDGVTLPKSQRDYSRLEIWTVWPNI